MKESSEISRRMCNNFPSWSTNWAVDLSKKSSKENSSSVSVLQAHSNCQDKVVLAYSLEIVAVNNDVQQSVNPAGTVNNNNGLFQL